MRTLSISLFAGVAALPLAWGACAEAPPAAPVAAIPTENDRSAAPVEPPGASGAPHHPPADATSSTRKAIDKALAALPPPKDGALSHDECQAIARPAGSAFTIAENDALSCAADSDCEVAPSDSCGMAIRICGTPIAKGHRAAYEAERKHIIDATCPRWNSGGCPTTVPMPVPSCNSNPPVCRSGKCGR